MLFRKPVPTFRDQALSAAGNRRGTTRRPWSPATALASAGLTSPVAPAVCAATAKRLAARCMAVPASCHALRHVLGDLVRLVQAERAQAQPLFGQFRGVIVMAGGERLLDPLQGQQMVAHAGEGVIAQRRGEMHELARVGRQAGLRPRPVAALACICMLVHVMHGHGRAGPTPAAAGPAGPPTSSARRSASSQVLPRTVCGESPANYGAAAAGRYDLGHKAARAVQPLAYEML